MKFSERMQSAINEQINFEMFSANTYLSMSAYFSQQGLDGFAHWYYMQYKEERCSRDGVQLSPRDRRKGLPPRMPRLRED